jgi:nucleoside-diphosphate-sugar epimerase
MRILVTGGSGFVGRHVVEAVRARGHLVVTPTHATWDCEKGPLAIEGRLDCVVHLAALCGGIGANMKRPADFWRVNLQIGLNVIEACCQSQVKLVLLGTTCSYPKFAPVPFVESSLFAGYPEETNAPYGIAKLALGVGLAAYEKQHRLKCAYLIPTNMYGEHDHFDLETSHVIPALIRKFIEAKKTGEPPILWGDGSPTRDFLYAGDCAKAIAEACERKTNAEPINLGTGLEIKMLDLARIICDEVGYKRTPRWDTSKPNGQPRRALDTTRAKERLGWSATTPLREGLKKTIAWYLAR